MKSPSLYEFGFENIGPVANAYLTKLHSYLCKCDGPDSKVLFLLRGGLRIHDLYRLWLDRRNVPPQLNLTLMKSSRMIGIKAAFTFNQPLSLSVLQKELPEQPLHRLINCLLKPEINRGNMKPYHSGDIPSLTLSDFLQLSAKPAEQIKKYLSSQSVLFKKYLDSLAGDAKRMVLIDTGWKGTTQLLFEGAFPEYQWTGVYFGCIGRSSAHDLSPSSMHGMMFDSSFFSPDVPETAFIVHRHLIESLFEPGISTFEDIERSDIGKTLTSEELLKNETIVEWDQVYEGVTDYIADHAADPPGKVLAAYQPTMERLAQILCYPSIDDLELACGKKRTHDMGRQGGVNTVLPAVDRFDVDTPELRIKQSIWRTAQAVLELSGLHARAKQQEILMNLMAPSAHDYFTEKKSDVTHQSKSGRHVAIITRTKNRPILLKRAADSVFRQSYDDYTWIIVNDGGIVEDVLEVVKASPIDPTKVLICSNPESLGMEAASNVGIQSCHSDYIIIHDDDDSWAPTFLSECVAFLESETGRKYGGVITQSLYVSEEIQGDHVIEHARVPYKDWVRTVQISEMWNENFFPPISFLFRRNIYEKLKGYDEKLPVLGDWDFNLRFLMEADIGVLLKPLAYYHHRDAGLCERQYANSVIGGVNKHEEFNTIVRNKFIRLAAKNGNPIGLLAAAGYQTQDLRARISQKSTTPVHIQDNPVHIDNQHWAQLWRADDLEVLTQISRHFRKHRFSLRRPVSFPLKRSIQKEMHPWPQKRVARLIKLSGTELAPPDNFNETAYLQRYLDVADAVTSGDHPSGYHHYVLYGRYEGRNR